MGPFALAGSSPHPSVLWAGAFVLAVRSPHPSAASPLPPSPEGKAKNPPLSSTCQRQRRKRDHGSYRRSRAYTPSSGSRPSTGKGICEQGYSKDFSLGVWGRSVKKMRRWRIFSGGWPAMPARSPFPESEKKCPPDLRTSRRAATKNRTETFTGFRPVLHLIHELKQGRLLFWGEAIQAV